MGEQAAGHTSYLSRETYRRMVVVLLSLLSILPMVVKSRTSESKPAPAAFSVPPAGLLVSVRGDVRHAGVYEVPANSVTMTVIELAVPARAIENWLPAGVERRPICAGEEIRLAFRPGSATADITVRPLPASQRMVLGIPLDINGMAVEDFDKLPGIGPALAQRIVDYRQSNGGRMTVRDLLNIEGIGRKKYFVLEKYF